MSDLTPPVTEEKSLQINEIESVFQSKIFPSDEEVRNLYESEISLGTAFSPISLTHYISNDERNPREEKNSDLNGALEEQVQMFGAFLGVSEEDKQKELVSAIQSPSGWKEIANELKDLDFGKKSLEYVRLRKSIEMAKGNLGLAKSLGETERLLENNFRMRNNGA